MLHFPRLSMRIFIINYASDLIKNLTNCRLERRGTQQRHDLMAPITPTLEGGHGVAEGVAGSDGLQQSWQLPGAAPVARDGLIKMHCLMQIMDYMYSLRSCQCLLTSSAAAAG